MLSNPPPLSQGKIVFPPLLLASCCVFFNESSTTTTFCKKCDPGDASSLANAMLRSASSSLTQSAEAVPDFSPSIYSFFPSSLGNRGSFSIGAFAQVFVQEFPFSPPKGLNLVVYLLAALMYPFISLFPGFPPHETIFPPPTSFFSSCATRTRNFLHVPFFQVPRFSLERGNSLFKDTFRSGMIWLCRCCCLIFNPVGGPLTSLLFRRFVVPFPGRIE